MVQQFSGKGAEQVMDIRKQEYIPIEKLSTNVTTTLFVAASINSSTDFTLVGVCWAIVEIICSRSLSILILLLFCKINS